MRKKIFLELRIKFHKKNQVMKEWIRYVDRKAQKVQTDNWVDFSVRPEKGQDREDD